MWLYSTDPIVWSAIGYSPGVGPRPESLSLNGGGRDGTSGDFEVEQMNGGGGGGGLEGKGCKLQNTLLTLHRGKQLATGVNCMTQNNTYKAKAPNLGRFLFPETRILLSSV